MRTIQKWMLIELTKPTIIGELYGDNEYYDGYSVQISVIDIDPVTRMLKSPNGLYKLGEPDKTWVRTRGFV